MAIPIAYRSGDAEKEGSVDGAVGPARRRQKGEVAVGEAGAELQGGVRGGRSSEGLHELVNLSFLNGFSRYSTKAWR